MNSNTLTTKAIRGVLWSFAARYGGKVMLLLSTIVLARLLSQEDFGVAAYALIVIGLLDVLRGMGVGPALIYYQSDPRAADTAFFLSLIVGCVLFATTLAIAPLVGVFFNDPRAVAVTQVLALSFPIAALFNVHDALLQKELAFKRRFVPDVLNAVTKGGVAIILAFMGFGAWSLVYGQLAGTFVSMVAYWWVCSWRPSWRFDMGLARSLLGFGSHIVAVNALGYLLTNAGHFVVGRFLGAASLGIYTLAFRLPDLIIRQIAVILGRVLFPTYVKLRDERDLLEKGFLTSMRYVALVTVPLGLGLAVVAEPLVVLLFSHKWIESAPVLQALSVHMMLISLSYNVGDIYKALGRPELLTRLALWRGLLLLPMLWWAAAGPGTLVAIAWVSVVVTMIHMMATIAVAARLLNVALGKVFESFTPALSAGVVMTLSVIAVNDALAYASVFIELVMSILVAVSAYIAVLWLIGRDILLNAGQHLRTALRRR